MNLNVVRCSLLFMFCCWCSIVFGGGLNRDSLLNKVKTKAPAEQMIAYKALATSLITKDFDMAIEYGELAMKKARELGDSISVGELHLAIGQAQYFMGNYEIAAENFFSAVHIFEQESNKKLLAGSFNDIAKLYRKTKELDRAEQYYDKAMALFLELNDSAGIEMIWNESGVVYEYRGDYDEARTRYTKALHIATATGNKVGLGYALNNISGAYTLEGKYQEAESYLLKALAIRQEMKDTFSLAINYSDLGAVYDSMQKYTEAIASFSISNTLATLLGYPELLSNNYAALSRIANKQNDYKTAYDYYLQADAINDSLYQVEKIGQIEELNTKYQTEKREQQIQLQQLKISRRNYLIIAISAILLMGAGLTYTAYRRYKTKQDQKMQTAIIHQQKIATQAVLQAEENERQRIGLDLHDGVGQMMSAVKINLSAFHKSIPFNSEEERLKYDNIIGLVDESCKEVRAISHTMMPNTLLKAGLTSAVRDFINKIDERVLDVNLYSEGLNERMNTDVETILYRVIQECVNNVIKHAQAKRLDISIINDDEGISITIEDNGRGFDTTKTDVFEGIGLKNIHTRVAYLKGMVDFDSRVGQGTVVTINIPCIA